MNLQPITDGASIGIVLTLVALHLFGTYLNRRHWPHELSKGEQLLVVVSSALNEAAWIVIVMIVILGVVSIIMLSIINVVSLILEAIL